MKDFKDAVGPIGPVGPQGLQGPVGPKLNDEEVARVMSIVMSAEPPPKSDDRKVFAATIALWLIVTVAACYLLTL